VRKGIRKKPLYEFGSAPKSRPGLTANFYESDFGSIRLIGDVLYQALGAHAKLKKPKRGGRQCKLSCGPCAAEPAFNKFLGIVFCAGGIVALVEGE
jgi:hypothetical protein